ncbi:DNA translocase FtsK [bacterium]|nr:DNA translocase FtsK [bacterium]
MKRIYKGILLVIFALFTAFALVSFDKSEWGLFWSADKNLCGPAGVYLAGSLRRLFGVIFSWVIPVFFAYWGYYSFRSRKLSEGPVRLMRTLILFFVASSIFVWAQIPQGGGMLASWTVDLLEKLTGRVGSLLIMSASFLLSAVLLFFGSVKLFIEKLSRRKIAVSKKNKTEESRSIKRKKAGILAMINKKTKSRDKKEPKIDVPKLNPITKKKQTSKSLPRDPSAGITAADYAPLPGLDILEDYDHSAVSHNREELLDRSEIIESKLADFGIMGNIKQVRPGPVVTTFEFVPAPGVRVNQIASRADDISLAMAAKAIRIQAPIPGKGAIGIEIPNPNPQMVVIKEMLEHYPSGSNGLIIALGKTTTGEPFYADLAEMPHLLIAGATGSGKSVCINSIITSLLFNHTPATCRFILIDPKRLELITYKGIPHLLHPVINETKDSIRVMNWLTIEMDRRYKLLAKFGVKNIAGFNEMVKKEKPVFPETGEKINILPFYVTIIDQHADIMISTGNEIYPPITRLSQMARAVGIHLIFATQRPSVDVVTGLIKANFPSRIAFQVTSKTDSRTILDANGAEKLLGNGDMLYLPKNFPMPVRLQGSFISEKDAKKTADYWRFFHGDNDKIDFSDIKNKDDVGVTDLDDDLFEKARELVIIHQQGSISLVQRRLRVGYARAARLIDMLEQSGVVGPYEGSKARQVLVTREEYEENG